jgi:hypothetical protein
LRELLAFIEGDEWMILTLEHEVYPEVLTATHLARQQQHPDDRRQTRRLRHKLTSLDWGRAQHQTALRTIALTGCMDQLDLPNLSSVEHLLRETQMVEFRYNNSETDEIDKNKKEKASGLSSHEMDLCFDKGKSFGESLVCPELVEHMAQGVERDALIWKQSRKAREEQALSRK